MIVDCDTHAMLPDAFEYMDSSFARLAPKLEFSTEDGSYDVVDFPGRPEVVPGSFPQARTGNKLRGAAFVEDRIEDFERLGVDAQLLMPNFTGWWSYLIEPELGAAMAHSHNLSTLNVMKSYPGRFLGIALVALQHVEASIQELRWARDNGFSAAVVDHAYPVREHPYGTSLGQHRELWPFFATAGELDMPLFIHNVLHGHGVLNCPRVMPLSLDEMTPSDSHINMVSLIYSGLLDDFPGLQFIIAEQGVGWIKPLAQLLDTKFERKPRNFASEESGGRASVIQMRKASVPTDIRARGNHEPPSYYLRRNFSWTIETEEPELAEAVEFLGPDRFLFATDYPHDDPGGSMKWRDVELLAANKRISEEDKELMRGENARRLFKLSRKFRPSLTVH